MDKRTRRTIGSGEWNQVLESPATLLTRRNSEQKREKDEQKDRREGKATTGDSGDYSDDGGDPNDDDNSETLHALGEKQPGRRRFGHRQRRMTELYVWRGVRCGEAFGDGVRIVRPSPRRATIALDVIGYGEGFAPAIRQALFQRTGSWRMVAVARLSGGGGCQNTAQEVENRIHALPLRVPLALHRSMIVRAATNPALCGGCVALALGPGIAVQLDLAREQLASRCRWCSLCFEYSSSSFSSVLSLPLSASGDTRGLLEQQVCVRNVSSSDLAWRPPAWFAQWAHDRIKSAGSVAGKSVNTTTTALFKLETVQEAVAPSLVRLNCETRNLLANFLNSASIGEAVSTTQPAGGAEVPSGKASLDAHLSGKASLDAHLSGKASLDARLSGTTPATPWGATHPGVPGWRRRSFIQLEIEQQQHHAQQPSVITKAKADSKDAKAATLATSSYPVVEKPVAPSNVQVPPSTVYVPPTLVPLLEPDVELTTLLASHQQMDIVGYGAFHCRESAPEGELHPLAQRWCPVAEAGTHGLVTPFIDESAPVRDALAFMARQRALPSQRALAKPLLTTSKLSELSSSSSSLSSSSSSSSSSSLSSITSGIAQLELSTEPRALPSPSESTTATTAEPTRRRLRLTRRKPSMALVHEDTDTRKDAATSPSSSSSLPLTSSRAIAETNRLAADAALMVVGAPWRDNPRPVDTGDAAERFQARVRKALSKCPHGVFDIENCTVVQPRACTGCGECLSAAVKLHLPPGFITFRNGVPTALSSSASSSTTASSTTTTTTTAPPTERRPLLDLKSAMQAKSIETISEVHMSGGGAHGADRIWVSSNDSAESLTKILQAVRAELFTIYRLIHALDHAPPVTTFEESYEAASKTQLPRVALVPSAIV